MGLAVALGCALVLIGLLLFLTNCAPIEKAAKVAEAGAVYVATTEPILREVYRAEQVACLGLEEANQVPCVNATRARWRPVLNALAAYRAVRCAIEPERCTE